ncbi:hypothetical protein [Streptomyces tibetensis]|uniref:hypothetical protein n=1 Tax=Streptomyces tibetensis TaxID=2382123 RepID=UPI0033DA2849
MSCALEASRFTVEADGTRFGLSTLLHAVPGDGAAQAGAGAGEHRHLLMSVKELV